jgi:protein-tyrosine phosphatase
VTTLGSHGVDTLVVLAEDAELEQAMVLDLPEVLAGAGIDLVRHPIPDPHVPTDTAAFRATVADVLARMRAGRSVAIACRGGLDRSGMAAACVLRQAGLDATAAVDRVHAAREHTLTRDEQLAYVRDWS